MGAPRAEESLPCRHTAVKSEGRVLLHLVDGPEEPHVVSVPKHKKHPPAGVKATTRTRVSSPAQRLVEMPNAPSHHRHDPHKSGLDNFAATCSRQRLLLTVFQFARLTLRVYMDVSLMYHLARSSYAS